MRKFLIATALILFAAPAALAQETPTEETQGQGTLTQEAPAGDVLAQDVPTADAPAEDTLAVEASAEEVPAEVALAVGTTADDAQDQGVLAQEVPAEEAPVKTTLAASAASVAGGDNRWPYLAIGAGALGGIWVANILSAGLLMPVVATGGVGAEGSIGVMGMGAAARLFAATGGLVTVGSSIAGGYIGAWLFNE